MFVFVKSNWESVEDLGFSVRREFGGFEKNSNWVKEIEFGKRD